MDYVQLTDIQLDALTNSAEHHSLVQIQPNSELDVPEQFLVWMSRVNQVSALVPMGFLEEQPVEGNEIIEELSKGYPGRTFKLFKATKLCVDMFNNPNASKVSN